MVHSADKSLQGIPLLRDLPTAARGALERSCTWRQLAAGQRLIDHDDRSDDVYFLVDGTLRIIIYAPNGRAVLFRAMAPGGVIGEFSALDGKPRSASVEATAPALVASLPGTAFRALVAREPAIALALLHQSIAYVRELSARIYQFSSLAVIERIHTELLRLGQEATVTGNQAIIDPAPRHVDIADRIATHREAISRELSQLARMGLVERRGKALVIKDMAALERLAATAGA
jgi:CRP/FNR family transcriptional regulator, cyclic AMP receptor protein